MSRRIWVEQEIFPTKRQQRALQPEHLKKLTEGTMPQRERRNAPSPASRVLERLLNSAQIQTLRSLEHFGWELKFVRKPLFQPSVPIIFDADRRHFAVIEEDGTLNENPQFTIRP